MAEVKKKVDKHNKEIEDQIKLREALKKENDSSSKKQGEESPKNQNPSKAALLGASVFIKLRNRKM